MLKARGVDGAAPEFWAKEKGPARVREVCRWADSKGHRGGQIVAALKGGHGTMPEPGSEAARVEAPKERIQMTKEEIAERMVRTYGIERARKMDPPMVKSEGRIWPLGREEWLNLIKQVGPEADVVDEEGEAAALAVKEQMAHLAARMGMGS